MYIVNFQTDSRMKYFLADFLEVFFVFKFRTRVQNSDTKGVCKMDTEGLFSVLYTVKTTPSS